jgi:protein-S-isoprenylcysteine O-methyltransferase Ste14
MLFIGRLLRKTSGVLDNGSAIAAYAGRRRLFYVTPESMSTGLPECFRKICEHKGGRFGCGSVGDGCRPMPLPDVRIIASLVRHCMNPWVAKVVVLAATLTMIAIRAPHGRRSRNVKVVRSHKTSLETGLLVLAWIGFFIPLIWLASPVLSFAEYPPRPGPLVAGAICFVIGLWLFYKSHADLGTNWSITLEVREQHRLITQGVYSRIRHPMYSALVLYSVGQALVIPNWVAGPSNCVAFVILFSLRVHAEEQMMSEAFGEEYAAYAARTKRLVPGVW